MGKKKWKFLYEKNFVITLSILVLIFLVIPIGNLTIKDSPIKFNQHFQENFMSKYDAYQGLEKPQTLISRYTYALNSAYFSKTNQLPKLENQLFKEDIQKTFDFVYNEIPFYSIVYPTEGYYYYKIALTENTYSGNIRLTNANEGKISFAYFDTEDNQNSNAMELGKEQGFFIKKITKNHYLAFYKNKLVIFKAFSDAKKENSNLKLLPGEEFIVGVHDESSIYFDLIFNNANNSFYYLLDETRLFQEEYYSLEENLIVGERTDFVFYNDTENSRLLLVGVDSFNIMANNYYDGPFDQVYPFLQNRERLYAAYPYTRYLHGLDEHGNFQDWEGSRVAISSYFNYWSDPSEVLEVLDSCESQSTNKEQLYSCLTYESKRDFHKTQPEIFYENGTVKPEFLLPDN